MRPTNQAARDKLDTVLRSLAPAGAADLAARLDVSLPTMLRILREQGERVVRIGTTKNARYALRRPLRGVAKPIPVYRIDAAGRGDDAGTLDLTQPAGAVLDLAAMGWPTDKEHRAGYWEGLPYPLYDMRPQGFLGRGFARYHHEDLLVPLNPRDWADDDIVHALSLYGSDSTGNLIVGDRAYRRWLAETANPEAPIGETGLPLHYLNLAAQAATLGVAGSSAAGEFPKFTAKREHTGAATPHVIVKFSGAETSSTVRRWADLLICEHLALETLAEHTDLPVAHTRIVEAGGRAFFEAERFDRHGLLGRSQVVTLDTLNGALLGSRETAWPPLAEQVVRMRLAAADLVDQVRILWWYGKLIGNTDMHLGNVSFRFRPDPRGRVQLNLAPAYDMLPMLYAPLSGGEIPEAAFNPRLPMPQERGAWSAAFEAAAHFWDRSADDTRVGAGFRTVCRENYWKLVKLSERA